MDCQRLFGTAALICLSLLASCGGGQQSPADPVISSTAGQRLDAAELRQAPGRTIDGIGFHLVDADMQVLPDWQGLELRGSLQDGFSLVCNADTPDDIYLAITFDDDTLQLGSVMLTEPAAKENLLLAVSRRNPDLAFLGLSRISGRGNPRSCAELARISFLPGSERMWRSASLVNEDPASAVELSIDDVLSESVLLSWEERNIGDYDNNGLVSISDITPIGLLFHETLAGHDPPGEVVLVDGDGNGEINLADLTPIARNFGRGLVGYGLYALNQETADPLQLELYSKPIELRANVHSAASAAQRRQRLQYTVAIHLPESGSFSLAVRAFDSDGSEGPFSNVVNLDILPGNLAPQWQGSLLVQRQVTGLLLSIPQAIDPESAEVSYRLCFTGSGDFPGSPHEGCIDLPAGLTTGVGPYEYLLEGLLPDVNYLLSLVASDPEENASTTQTVFERMPLLQPDNAAVWDTVGSDIARSSALPASGLHEPLEVSADLVLLPGDIARRNEPLMDEFGNFLYASGSDLRQFSFEAGADTDSLYDPLGEGYFLGAVSRINTGRYLCCLNGASLWYSQIPTALQREDLDSTGAPLLLGELLFIGRPDGSLLLRNVLGGQQLESAAAGSPSLSLCSDGDSVFQLCEDGTLRRSSMPFFEDVLSAELPAPQPGSSLIYLSSIDALAVTLPDGNMTIRSATDLTEIHITDAAVGASETCAAAVQWTDPPMLLIGEADSGNGGLRAISLADYAILWEEPVQVETISASADRIFIRNSSELQVRDFQGRLRQSVPMASHVNSQPVLDAEGLAAVHGANLSWLEEAVSDLPPVWQGTEGLRELEVGDGQVALRWDHAVDDHNEVVNYMIYYSDVFPPDPYGLWAQQEPDIPDSGNPTHEHVISGLDNGTRYWFIVQAYDGYVNDNPNFEQNLNWLAATPPWRSEELILGQDLPAGEIYYMRGIADPAGGLHLVYNDEATTMLTHLFGDTASWQSETAGLAGHASNALDLAWDAELLIGRAHNFPPGLSVLRRTAADSYSETAVAGSTPLQNPQLAVAIGSETGLAWTEYVSGSLPQPLGHYYYSPTQVGSFLPPVPIEEPLENYGRDLDLLYNPLDATDPWLCFQRGVTAVDNRLTPVDGTLHFWRDLGSGLAVEDVDLGANPGDSDVGKRVRMVLDDSGHPLLAYYDLDSDPLQPRGQLKTARWDAGQWNVSVLENRDLAFQDMFTYRHTAPELSLASAGNGTLAIGELLRASMPASLDLPHAVGVRAWIDSGSGFELEVLTEPLWMLPSDREPCVALYDNADILHIFVATAQEPLPGEDYVADTILHLWRGE